MTGLFSPGELESIVWFFDRRVTQKMFLSQAPLLGNSTNKQKRKYVRNIRNFLSHLLVLELRVPGLDDEALEGGVVRGGELEAEQLARLHPATPHPQQPGGGAALRGVVVPGSHVCRENSPSKFLLP